MPRKKPDTPVAKVRKYNGVRLPKQMEKLPVDKTRKLPIPFMNMIPGTGEYDFLTIKYPAVAKCIAEDLCGICGTKLEWFSAFVGGPLSTKAHTYSDPPFHPECARFAMQVCPHIIIGRHKRASEDRVGPTVPNDLVIMDKPSEWILGIAKTVENRVAKGRGGALHFRSGSWVETVTYSYNDEGKLTRNGSNP